jgi:hypothetical protein
METLPEDKKEKARDAVVNLVLRLKGLKDEEEEVGSSNEGPSELSDVDSDDSDADLEILRKNLSQGNVASVDSSFEEESEVAVGDSQFTSTPQRPPSRPRTPASGKKKSNVSELKAEIIEQVYDGLDKLSKKKNSFKKSKKELLTLIDEEYPAELQEVARLLYAKPVTQVSVERLFSALKIFKEDSRSRLKEDILSALLILKANQ